MESTCLPEMLQSRFIDGATRLRGMARSLDVAQVITSIRKLDLKVEDREPKTWDKLG